MPADIKTHQRVIDQAVELLVKNGPSDFESAEAKQFVALMILFRDYVDRFDPDHYEDVLQVMEDNL